MSESRNRKSTNGRLLPLAARWAPEAAARVALALWLRPPRHRPPEREQAWIELARPERLRSGLRAWSWGDGPPVLLVHGWGGRASQMGALGTALASAGHRAIALDLPAHGRSAGRTLTLPEAAGAVGEALEAWQVERVVAHSFGAAAAAAAIGSRPIGGLVLLAPPDPSRMLGRYAAWLGLGDDVRARMERRLVARAGVGPDQLSAAVLASTLAAPGLVVHDPDDPFVPFEDGERWAAAWDEARLLEARGQGHFRILRAPEVVDEVVAFITPTERREQCMA